MFSLVALLFFPVDLFMPPGRYMSFTAGPLFFLIGLSVLYALFGEALFFSLGLYMFVLLFIVNLFFFSVGLFVFQRDELITVTLWIF